MYQIEDIKIFTLYIFKTKIIHSSSVQVIVIYVYLD